MIGGVLASAAVIIGAWEAGQSQHAATTARVSPGDSTGSAASGSSGTSTSTGAATSAGFKDGTFTGSTSSTRYGDVEVQVVVSGGKITAVNALHLTDADGRSVMISRYAAPQLQQEVLSAQSAQVDTISGATTTSDGYLHSLQAALDQAQ